MKLIQKSGWVVCNFKQLWSLLTDPFGSIWLKMFYPRFAKTLQVKNGLKFLAFGEAVLHIKHLDVIRDDIGYRPRPCFEEFDGVMSFIT